MRTTTFALLLLISFTAFSQEEEIRKRSFNIKKGVAIEGYDPVSYFDQHPVPGQPGIQFEYKGVVYRFSSARNLSRFKEDPAHFEPAYGGWCAYAMGATGEKVKIDPETWKIVDGKLCLFYNFWGNNTLTTWNADEKKLKTQAEIHWRAIQH